MNKFTFFSISFLLMSFQFASYGAILENQQLNINRKKVDKTQRGQKTPVIKLSYRRLPSQKLSESRKRIIVLAAQNWQQVANLEFKFLPENSSETPDYDIDIYASESTSSSRESRGGHGSVDFTNKTISLNMPEDTSLSELYQVPLHEFGHILGLMHEHQHPDRPFSFDFELLFSKCHLGSPLRCRLSIEYNNMRVFEGKDYQLVEYDPNSIMHYGVAKPLILEDMSFPQSLRLSLQDKQTIRMAYPGRISELEINRQHDLEDQQIKSLISGECRLEKIPSSDRFQYLYPDGTAGRFLDKTIDGVYMSAKLDPKCSGSIN